MLNKFNPQSMPDEALMPATLLEMGDTLNFIEVRKHSLRNQIKESKLSASVGKMSGIGAIAGGGFLTLALSNPLGQLIAAGGAVGYGLAVFGQWMQTGKVQPMPLSSKTSEQMDMDLAGSTISGGDAIAVQRHHAARAAINEDSAYLASREKIEYELLHFAPEGLLSAMGHVPPQQRWACYQFLIDAFVAGTIQSYYENPQALRDILGSPSLYSSHLNEARARFPGFAEGAIDGDIARKQFTPPPVEHRPAPQIGEATRLGAVDVPAQPLQQQAQPSALSALIASPFLSRAFFGAQRTGKSYLAAIASHELSKQGIQIFHINLASFGDEDATYWQHATRSVRADLSSLSGMQAQGFIDAAIDCIHQFFQTRNAILIFDEITLTGSLSNQHSEALDPLLRLTADKVACLASTGTKRGQAIWTLSPDFVAGALSQQTKAVKSLALVFVAIAPGRFVDWKGNRIGFHAESFGNVQRNFPVLTTPPRDTGCDRICFVDGKWLTVGDLPSLPKLAVPDYPPTVPKSVQVNDRERLDSLLQSEATHPVENLYHGEADDSELAVRAEIKRFLLANPDGSKPRDLSARSRKPVKGMPVDDVKFVMDLMNLEGEIYEVDGTFFANTN